MKTDYQVNPAPAPTGRKNCGLQGCFEWYVLLKPVDLARKLVEFRDYYNACRVDRSYYGITPAQRAGAPSPAWHA